MVKTYKKLENKTDTINEMVDIIKKYHTDLIEYSDWTIQKFFDYVKNYPYKEDIAPIEELRRPKYFRLKKFADCKKKSIMIASFLELKKIPYRLVTSSSRKNKQIHHVFVQAKNKNGDWINIDATYPDYSIGQAKKVTAFEIDYVKDF